MQIKEEKINSIKKNIFYRSRNTVEDYYTFDWHKSNGEIDTNRENSSQALAIDFWGCIKTSKYKNEVINMLFKKNESDWNILFEYEEKALLNEEKKSTQIDILLKGSKTAIFIESKFTEKDGGSCSQTKKTKKGFVQCSGNYEKQVNPINNVENKCSLSGKGIKYWRYIDKITTLKENATYNPCPIKKGEYQWIRNMCFAKAYSEKNEINIETFLVYVDSPKCSIADKVKKGTYLGALKGKLIEDAFCPISYNDSLDKIINYFNNKGKNEKQVFVI